MRILNVLKLSKFRCFLLIKLFVLLAGGSFQRILMLIFFKNAIIILVIYSVNCFSVKRTRKQSRRERKQKYHTHIEIFVLVYHYQEVLGLVKFSR